MLWPAARATRRKARARERVRGEGVLVVTGRLEVRGPDGDGQVVIRSLVPPAVAGISAEPG